MSPIDVNNSTSSPVDLCLWENDGEIIVYHSKTLEIVKRLSMNKPVAKYNVYNIIHGSEGTSRH